MATKIVTKNSSTASAVPTASDLVQGELAVNVADKRLFTEDNGGAIVELGTNPSSLTVSGNIDVDGTTNLDAVDIDGAVDMASTLTVAGEITANGGIALGDNDKATFGAGNDLQIYHDGSASRIHDAGTGDLIIAGQTNIILGALSGEEYLRATENGAVSIKHDNAQKLTTTSTGIDVTGTATMDGLQVSTTGNQVALLESEYGGSTLHFRTGNGSNSAFIQSGVGGAVLTFKTGGDNERMRIDSSGNVGIGTSSPDEQLHIHASSGDGLIKVSGDGSETSGGLIKGFNGGLGIATTDGSGNYPERMRIDSSGNLLVGKSASSFTTAGVELAQGGTAGKVQIQRSSSPLALVNLTDDGNILNFYKGTSAVGSIGVVNSTNPYFTSASRGIRISGNNIRPCSTGGANLDDTISLGDTGQRFKDLYLSGGVLNGAADSFSFITGGNASNGGANVLLYGQSHGSSANVTVFRRSGTESARIDSSGNLFVATTSTALNTSNSESGHTLFDSGYTVHSRSAATVMSVNRLSNDGNIVDFRKDGTVVGSIGTESGYLAVGSPHGQGGYLGFRTNMVYPSTSTGGNRDNIIDLGGSSQRFDDIHATNGTIQTSDRNEKQDIEDLTEAEERVAIACKGLLKKFRWKSAVEEKGEDARIHFGIIAQDLQDAFEAEGLDAGDYAMFISSTWTDEETNEEKTRMGVRYSELLAFIISAI